MVVWFLLQLNQFLINSAYFVYTTFRGVKADGNHCRCDMEMFGRCTPSQHAAGLAVGNEVAK